MELLLIALVAFATAVLTFFSGFGLGTLLLPVFLLFFPVEAAVALTAIVHLVNNLFKAGLMGRYARWNVVLRFGLPALPGAWFGAYLLGKLTNLPTLHTWSYGTMEGDITLVKLIIAVLMTAFAILELLPASRQPVFGQKALSVGGFISGFFGGLSGHQGALRSAFLLRLGLTKDTFIATGILIACGIDLVRITTYFIEGLSLSGEQQWYALFCGATSAILGAILGKRLLKKITLPMLHRFVAVAIFLLALLLAVGLV